jgi:hypothetical protein
MAAAPPLAADEDQSICRWTCVPQACETHFDFRTLRDVTRADTRAHLAGYCDAVVLFSMFTTCTRRFTSESGWFESFSLVLP